jgi:hypothetical protein
MPPRSFRQESVAACPKSPSGYGHPQRSVFAQENAADILSRWDDLAVSLAERFPKAAELMNEPTEEVLAYSCGEDFVNRHFPGQHWKKIWSTNLLERVNVAPRGALRKKLHKAPHPRRRHLPQGRRDYPPGWGGAAGAGRALAAGGPPYVLRRENGSHSGAGGSACPAQRSRLRGATPMPRTVQ